MANARMARSQASTSTARLSSGYAGAGRRGARAVEGGRMSGMQEVLPQVLAGLVEIGLVQGFRGARPRQGRAEVFDNAAGARRQHVDAVGQEQGLGNAVRNERSEEHQSELQ